MGIPIGGIQGSVDFLRTVGDEHPFELCSAPPSGGTCPPGTSLGPVLTNADDCMTVDTTGLTELWSVCTAHVNMVDQFPLAPARLRRFRA